MTSHSHSPGMNFPIGLRHWQALMVGGGVGRKESGARVYTPDPGPIWSADRADYIFRPGACQTAAFSRMIGFMDLRESSFPALLNAPSKPRILAVDTSSAQGSLALLSGGETIGKAALEEGKPHSRMFFQQLDELSRSAGIQLDQIDLFVVVTGPGSFTGLRVGMAAMSGLARARQKTLLGVTAFDAWAEASGATGEVTVIIEAGRNQVYCGVRRVTPDGRVTIEVPDRMLDRCDISGVISSGVDGGQRLIVGAVGAAEAESLVIDGHRVWEGRADLAAAAGRLAGRRYLDGESVQAVPYYIRVADAQEKARAGK